MTKANFEMFNDIQHLPLKVFNRVVLMSNLMEDAGRDTAEVYAEMFTEGERKQMYLMQGYIKSKGVETVRKEVTRNLQVVYDVGEDQ